MRLGLIHLIAFGWLTHPASALQTDAPGSFSAIAVDKAGRILALDSSRDNSLAMYEGGVWREFRVELGNRSASAQALLALQDGRVASLWSLQDHSAMLVLSKGNRVTDQIPLPWTKNQLVQVALSEDQKGGIWIAGAHPEVLKVNLADHSILTFNLSAFADLGSSSLWNPVCTIHLPDGQTWLYSANFSGKKRGVARPLLVSGISLIRQLSDLPAQMILSIFAQDSTFLWILSQDKGVIRVDPVTKSYFPLSVPERHPVRSLIPHGKMWIAIVQEGLFRLKDEKWSKIQPPSTTYPIEFHGQARNYSPAFLEFPSGTLIALAQGALFVPYDSEAARLLNWRDGFPMQAIRQMAALDDDRFTAISSGFNPPGCMLALLSEFFTPKSAANLEEIHAWRGWLVAPDERIFSLLDRNSAELSVFEKDRWRRISLPAQLKNHPMSNVVRDQAGRIWVFSFDPLRPAGILSQDLQSGKEQWTTFDSYQDALLANRPYIGTFTPPLENLQPILSPDGRIAYRENAHKLGYWDGAKWHSWDTITFEHPKKFFTIHPPFFDSAGHLCFNPLSGNFTLKLEDSGEWKSHAREPDPPAPTTGSRADSHKLPPTFPFNKLKNPKVATDNHGVTWVVAEGRLFKHIGNRTAELFPDCVHPFLLSPDLRSVRVDRHRNTWLELEKHHHIRIPPSPNNLRATVEATPHGLVTIKASIAGELEWLEGEQWRAIPDGRIGYLPPGRKTLQVRLLTPKLDILGPLVLSVSIQGTTKSQIAHLIKILHEGPDAQRELALSGLLRHGPTAIPILQNALSSPGANVWWIEAAIAQLKEKPSSKHAP